jgi:hypothetical protein
MRRIPVLYVMVRIIVDCSSGVGLWLSWIEAFVSRRMRDSVLLRNEGVGSRLIPVVLEGT